MSSRYKAHIYIVMSGKKPDTLTNYIFATGPSFSTLLAGIIRIPEDLHTPWTEPATQRQTGPIPGYRFHSC
jgi:hypothetical protein